MRSKDRLLLTQMQDRITTVERRVNVVEETMAAHMNDFSGYKSKSQVELADAKSKLQMIVVTLEGLVQAAENSQDVESAKALLRRARNNFTRALNASQRIS